jgi:hypothetical protein
MSQQSVKIIPINISNAVIVPTVPILQKNFTVEVKLSAKNNYYYNGSHGVATVNLKEQSFHLPSGTQVEIFDQALKQNFYWYVVNEIHSSSDIPAVEKCLCNDSLKPDYPINLYGFAFDAPIGTVYNLGNQPPLATCTPTSFILPQHCEMILPKGTLLRSTNEPTDACCFPCDKIVYLADVFYNKTI